MGAGAMAEEGGTKVERTSERELVVTRHLRAPARLVFEAWTRPELFRRWWVPVSCGMSLLECDMEARAAGGYKLTFSHPSAPAPFTVFGRYIEVTPHSRLVWTNEESGEDGQISTVTLEETGGITRQVLHERYPSKEALDEAIASGSTDGLGETFDQLEQFLAGAGREP